MAAAQVANDIDASARQLFLDASAAYEKGDNAKAYALLLVAWKVKPHWQIAASLGAVEMAVGKLVDAANHVAYYLREAPPDRKEKATKLLAEATAKVGTITVTSEPSDAEIVVDGAKSGAKSGEPFYVTADERHVVTVRRGEQQTDLELIVGAGKSHEAKVVLEDKKARRLWPVIGVGAGVTAVAAGVGIGLTMAAKDAQRQVEQTQPLVKSPCAKQPAAGPCKDLTDAASRHDAMAGGAIGLFVVAGVVGAATVAYGIWPEILPVRPAVAAGPNGAAVSITGRF